MADHSSGVRIDKWLWAVRVYKTRSQATDACRKGRVTLLGHTVKPGKNIQVGDIITVYKDNIRYVFRVKGLIVKRTSAKFVSEYMEDITPAEELERKKITHTHKFVFRPKGLGRPTKKERRMLDRFRNDDF
ncbi:MAG TPA: RNA-binding S4 domain-containing protein [Bacteroidetes bacterium]|nr:RNA-binding S4 domain-containing protein [Bacteroidota bacterium]